MDWDEEHAVKIDCAPTELVVQKLETLSECKQSFGILYMATVQDQERAHRRVDHGHVGMRSSHCDDGQPVAFTTAIAETITVRGDPVLDSSACRSITFGMEQISLESSSPSTR